MPVAAGAWAVVPAAVVVVLVLGTVGDRCGCGFLGGCAAAAAASTATALVWPASTILSMTDWWWGCTGSAGSGDMVETIRTTGSLAAVDTMTTRGSAIVVTACSEGTGDGVDVVIMTTC